MNLKIPKSIKAEHDSLHAQLVRIIHSGGQTQEAARRLARVLHPHFLAEEALALPPLGVLKDLAKQRKSKQAEKAISLSQSLERNLARMLQDHKDIFVELKALQAMARKEGKIQIAEFAEHLYQHARIEEEVVYPTTILIGRYLQMEQKKDEAAPAGRSRRQKSSPARPKAG